MEMAMTYSQLLELSSTLLADVGAGAMHSRIRSLVPGKQLVGKALTVHVAPGDNLAIHAALAHAKPGDVLVVDGEGFTERALMGGIMMTQAKATGIAGVVIDGAMRDVQELQALGLPAFAAAVHPAGPFKDGPGSLYGPIQCGGVEVNNGDWIFGDDDGVVVMPEEKLATLMEAAQAKKLRELDRISAILRGDLKPDWLESALEKADIKILKIAKVS